MSTNSRRKRYNEKLSTPGDLPKIAAMDAKAAARLKGSTLLIAPPLDYDALMRRVPEGKVTAIPAMREHLARRYGADVTCPLTAGIFTNITAHASVEREEQGLGDPVPYWRTLRKDGELNEKFPGGIDGHRLHLQAEGHEVFFRGKKWFVKGYEDKLADLGE